jgi:hypothetical protein
MPVDVEIFGILGEGKEHSQVIELESQVPVSVVAVRLGIDPETVGMVTIDGVQKKMEDSVPEICRLCFFPPMSGG